MKTQIATTQDQSARLLRCGVSADTADMCWYIESGEINIEKLRLDTELIGCSYDDPKRHYKYIPAWSLSALLGLLPTAILSPMGNKYMLELSKLRMNDAWEVQWFNGREKLKFRTYDKQKVFHKLWDKSPIEACVKAIEWLAANGYKLNEQ